MTVLSNYHDCVRPDSDTKIDTSGRNVLDVACLSDEQAERGEGRRRGRGGSRGRNEAPRPAAARAGICPGWKILRPVDTAAGRYSGFGRPAQCRESEPILYRPIESTAFRPSGGERGSVRGGERVSEGGGRENGEG
jgi:hypothetical protein